MVKNKGKTNPEKQTKIKKEYHRPRLFNWEEEEQLLSKIQQSEEVHIVKADFIDDNANKEKRKKVAMERFLGVKQDENIDKRQKLFKNIFTTLFVVFVIGVIAFTFYNDFFATGKKFPPFSEVKELLKNSWAYVFLCLICLFFHFLAKAIKVSIMCKSTTGRFHFGTCFETSIIGTYYNNVTPFAAGGQPFEIYHLSKHGVHGGAAASLPIASFFMTQIAFVILTTVCLVLFKKNTFGMPAELMSKFPPLIVTMAIIGLVFCFLGPTLVVMFSLMPKIGARLVFFVMNIGDKLRIVKNPKETAEKTVKSVVHNAKCLKKIGKNPLVFISSFLLSFIEHIANASIAFFALKLFGFHLNNLPPVMEWLIVVQIVLILYVAVSLVPTPGNAGAADLSFYLIFEFGLAAGLGFPAMCVWRFFSFYCVIIIGFLFATIRKKSDLKREAFVERFSGSTPKDIKSAIEQKEDEELEREAQRTIDAIIHKYGNSNKEDENEDKIEDKDKNEDEN